MIDFTKLKFGDKVYIAKDTNNAFSKKKIKKVIKGVEWFRYDMDNWTYTIEEIVYCGKVTHIEEGEVRFEEDRITEYHFKYPDGQIYHEWEGEDTDHLHDWFYTKEEAASYIEELKASRSE
jgi:hypothetical protein